MKEQIKTLQRGWGAGWAEEHRVVKGQGNLLSRIEVVPLRRYGHVHTGSIKTECLFKELCMHIVAEHLIEYSLGINM